jgi:alpha-galactosidase/6-phospho-beta-glucosidase family protein
LAKILTPQELQNYELTTSATAPALRARFEGFDVSDPEYRKVFDFMQPLDERYSLSRKNPDPVNQEFTAERNQAEKDVQEYIHQVLGDDRYSEYQRTRDPVYRTINQIGSEAGLPKESIVQAYQAQQQMQEEAKRLMQDPSLNQEQRVQSLQDLRGQAQQKIQQLFGDKGAQMLQQIPDFRLIQRYGLSENPNPGVNNLAPTTPP